MTGLGQFGFRTDDEQLGSYSGPEVRYGDGTCLLLASDGGFQIHPALFVLTLSHLF
jgi:hypothetical protein